MGLRERVALLTALAVGIPAVLLAWWAETSFEQRLVADRAEELERTGRLLIRLAAEEPFSDALADRLGEAAGLRVTLVDPTGALLGDSEIPAERIGGVESHAGRPEIRSALRGRIGVATRISRTVSLSLLYVAVPFRHGALRVSVPLGEVTAPADRLVRLAAGAAAALVLLLIVSAGLQARFVAEPLRSLRRDLEAMASGERTRPRGGREEPGEVGRLTGASHRIADRLEESRRAETTARELESAFDRLDEALALLDDDGVVRRANRAFRAWVGREDVEGHGLRPLFRDPEIGEALGRGLRGETLSREVEVGDRTALFALRPLDDGVLAVFRDLTRLRRLEGVRRDFVANVSHELKTPLTSVLGFAEPLTDPELPRDEVVRFAERILVNGTRMRRLVDDLLDLSRIEAGAWEPEPARVELGPVAASVWEDLTARSEATHPELRLDVEAAPAADVDPEALRQILRNLLDNALRHAPEGSVVTVASRREGERIRLDVSDQGPGIPEAHRERVFERFYRVDPGRSREAGGTGLGLAIVKHLVAAHGGEVDIDSRVGEGTTVRLSLPAA